MGERPLLNGRLGGGCVRFREQERVKNSGLKKSPDIAGTEMVRNVGKLTERMKLFRADGRMAENAGPSVKAFPILLKDSAFHRFIKLSPGVRRRNGELDGECV
jgi:hypothetical protein